MVKKIIFVILTMSACLFAYTNVAPLPAGYPTNWCLVISDQFIIGTSLDRFNIRFFDANGVVIHNGDNLFTDILATDPAFNHMLAAALAAQAKGKIACILQRRATCTGEICYDLMSIDITY